MFIHRVLRVQVVCQSCSASITNPERSARVFSEMSDMSNRSCRQNRMQAASCYPRHRCCSLLLKMHVSCVSYMYFVCLLATCPSVDRITPRGLVSKLNSRQNILNISRTCNPGRSQTSKNIADILCRQRLALLLSEVVSRFQ